jgi:hypothetical protein
MPLRIREIWPSSGQIVNRSRLTYRFSYHGGMGLDLAVVVVTYDSAHVVEQLLDSMPARSMALAPTSW